MFTGDGERAGQLWSTSLETNRKLGDRGNRGEFLFALICHELRRGREAEAEQLLSDLCAHHAEYGVHSDRSYIEVAKLAFAAAVGDAAMFDPLASRWENGGPLDQVVAREFAFALEIAAQRWADADDASRATHSREVADHLLDRATRLIPDERL